MGPRTLKPVKHAPGLANGGNTRCGGSFFVDNIKLFAIEAIVSVEPWSPESDSLRRTQRGQLFAD
jgi:hypothetical protein